MGIGDARANDRLMKSLTLLAWYDHVSRRGSLVETAKTIDWEDRNVVASDHALAWGRF